MGTPGTGSRPYSACGKQRAYNTDSSEPFIVGRSLLTKGFVLDALDRVEDKATHGAIPSSWLDLVDWQDHNTDLPSRFWRLLVGDRDLDGLSRPPAYFPLACKWAFSRRTALYDLSTDRLLHHGKCPELCFNFLRRLQAVVWGRRLSLTKGTKHADGQDKTEPLLSLVPSAAQKGDLICILYGCSVPVVLRKREAASPPSNHAKRKAEFAKPPRKGTLKMKRQRTLPSDMNGAALLGGGYQFGDVNTSPPMRGDDIDSVTWSNNSCENVSGAMLPPFMQAQSPETQKASLNNSSNGAAVSATSEVPLGEQYEFIGECYVHGMMAGEAFKHREDTGNAVKEFWLV